MKQKEVGSYVDSYAQSITKIIFGVILTMLSGCGFKDMPVPPQEIVPQAIDDLRYERTDGGVHLSWSYPIKTIQGNEIENISNFELYRAGVPLDKYCPNCPIPFGSPQRLPGGSTLDATKRRTAGYDINGLHSGYKYFFKVVSSNSWWAKSDSSNIVAIVYTVPPAIPAGLQAKAGDGSVHLRWSPVITLKNGGKPSGAIRYEVLRNGEKIADSATPLFTDSGVQNEQEYSYSVRAVMTDNDDLITSALSQVVTVKPVDKTAPAVICSVRAVGVHKGNTIFWDGSNAKDLKEYRIYRRKGTNGKYTLLATVEKQYTVFTDTDVDDFIRYYYVVTAVDVNGNESGHSTSVAPRE